MELLEIATPRKELQVVNESETLVSLEEEENGTVAHPASGPHPPCCLSTSVDLSWSVHEHVVLV